MPELVGLPGVKAKSLEARIFHRAKQASRLLRTNRALMAADDFGSVSVWIDDTGRYCAEFYQPIAKWRGKKKTDLTLWLMKWMPKMRESSI